MYGTSGFLPDSLGVIAPSQPVYLWALVNSCLSTPSAVPTDTPTPLPTNTPTPVPTNTPVTTPTPGSGIPYNNTDVAVANALGCTTQVVDQVRALNLDPATSYLIMRLTALCGCSPAAIMNLRLTMGWDQICAQYGLDWTTFTTDLQTRVNTLKPEVVTPNQIIRAAANDPTVFPIDPPPAPMPDHLVYGNPYQEVCPTCQ